ncbi:MAG: cyclic nucleotide-binding domain-containing protein [bacterium]|nr:cyclic nucleotide-binding domain-containing protein [bacterium]
MTQNFIKLYSTSSEPDCAFLLSHGSVFFYASEMDKYAIKGNNLIVGATEVIMNHMLNESTERMETAVADPDSSIKRMPVEKFISGMNSYSFILNVSMVLAKQVLLTNRIINKNLSELSGDENETRKLSIQYYSIVDSLKDEWDKRKLPWLKDLVKKFEVSLVYKRGEAYFRSSEPTKIEAATQLTKNLVEYPRGTVICEENTSGEEMYILQSGTIDVLINENKVAAIEEPGTVSGEMALLLGEKRTATLKAKNNVVLTRITKKDLKEIAKKENSQEESNILQGVSFALAKRHYYNTVKIGSINKSILEQALAEEDGSKKPSQLQNTKKELRSLKNALTTIAMEKKVDFLDKLLDAF